MEATMLEVFGSPKPDISHCPDYCRAKFQPDVELAYPHNTPPPPTATYRGPWEMVAPWFTVGVALWAVTRGAR